jgi:succinoglycan biosynthesis transport protein ExoP
MQMRDKLQNDHRDLLPVTAAVPPATAHTVSHSEFGRQDSVHLNVLTAALWQGKGVIAFGAIAGVLTGLGITLVATPMYRARASLQLEGFNNNQFLSQVAPISPSVPNASPDNYLQNAVKLLESETLAKRVASQLGIQPTPGSPSQGALIAELRNRFRFLRSPSLTPGESRIRAVQRSLTIRTSMQSQVIELFYDSLNAVSAAQGANAVASEFVELSREARWELAQDTTDWLNNQAANLKTTLEKSNQELQDFARSAGLVFAGKQSTLAEDRMRQVQDAFAKAESERAAKQARFEAAQANPGVLISDSQTGGVLQQYQASLQNLRRELAELQTLYTPNNYRVQRVQAEIAEAENSIAHEQQNALSRLRTEYLAAAGLEQLLSQAEAAQLKTVEQQMENERLYEVKKSEVEATQRLYEAMLQKVKEAGAASAFRTTDVRIIDGAEIPSVPYSPNPQLNIALGLAIGTVGGVGLALIRAGSDHKVKLPGQLGLPEIPELGVIPSVQIKEASILGEGRLTLFKGSNQDVTANRGGEPSLWHESFRAVLTSILFSGKFHHGSAEKLEDGRVLVVTSFDVMEGKTVVVTNLGQAAAEQKRRVLLIDGDLRRPRLHERLDLFNDRGLTDLLQSGGLTNVSDPPLDALVQPTRIPNLWLLPSGAVEAAGPSLLYACSSNLASIVRRFRREFDLILIDTPPLMFCADARLLGKVSDGLIMVVRANRRSREELRSAYAQFFQDQISVLGTILNDWKMDPSQIRSYRRYQVHYRRPSS